MRHTTLHRLAEQKVGPLGPWFLKCDREGRTLMEMARILDLPPSTVAKWKARYLDIRITRTVEIRELTNAR